jgi:excinuclease ABC subunit C
MRKAEFEKLNFPDCSGVYLFKKGKDVLYIGKATSLRDRARSYFGIDVIDTRGPHIVDMVLKSDTVEFQKTDSVLEAIILEANLIKKFQPYYNTKEKDNKSFNYVVVTDEDFPAIVTVRERELAKTRALHGKDLVVIRGTKIKIKKIFGPFPSGGQLKIALNIIRKIFPFRDKKSGTKGSDEFYRQLALAPDTTQSGAQKEYENTIRNIILFFEGKKKTLLKSLEREMLACAKHQEFEKANDIKRKLFSLKHINDISLLKNESKGPYSVSQEFRVEAYDVAHMNGKNMIGVMTVIHNGEVDTNEYRTFNIKGFTSSNDVGALTEVLSRRFAHPEWQYPNLIVLDGGVAQLRAGEKFQKQYGLSIPIVAVVKDERHRPKGILGKKEYVGKYNDIILLANSEAHRFSISKFRKSQRKSFGL